MQRRANTSGKSLIENVPLPVGQGRHYPCYGAAEAVSAFYAALDNYTLEDMVRDHRPPEKILFAAARR